MRDLEHDADWFKKLGACINLVKRGGTEGERSSAQARVDHMIAQLTPAEIRIITRGLPGVANQPNAPPRTVRHRTGTKREEITSLLRQGYFPKTVAYKVGCKVQYVYKVKRDLGL
jgi:hypothetical protein